jgi:hypothetical protein
MLFNVNEKVQVRLNDSGRKIQAEYHAPWSGGPKPDSDGWTEYQMWELMHIFGQHCYMGPEPPFATVIRIMAGESERDALRAEVEVLRRAVEDSKSEMAILRGALRGVLEWMPVLAKIEGAISEAGKDKEGEG